MNGCRLQFERKEGNGAWTLITFVGAAIWSMVCLGLTATYVSFFVIGLWWLDVSESNSANSSGEPNLDLTRAQVLQNFWPFWWPLLGLLLWFGVILLVTREMFGPTRRTSRRFSLGLSLACGAEMLGWWIYLALDIWHKYGAPLPH